MAKNMSIQQLNNSKQKNYNQIAQTQQKNVSKSVNGRNIQKKTSASEININNSRNTNFDGRRPAPCHKGDEMDISAHEDMNTLQ